MGRMVDRMVKLYNGRIVSKSVEDHHLRVICGSFKGQLVAIWGSIISLEGHLNAHTVVWEQCSLWRIRQFCVVIYDAQHGTLYTRSRYSLRWMQSWLTNAKLLGNAGPTISITSFTTMLLMAFFKVLQVRRTSQPRQDASFLLAGQSDHHSSTLRNLNPKWEWSVDGTADIVQMAKCDADVCAA